MTHTSSIPPEGSAGKSKQTQSNILILAIHALTGGNLKAFVDVQLGPSVTIFGFRIIQQAGQKAWVSAPQREYTDQSGIKRYAPIVELTGNLKDRVEHAIMAAWEESGHE
jgi:DNA-binding cell septation regulator SpoVG